MVKTKDPVLFVALLLCVLFWIFIAEEALVAAGWVVK